MVERLISYIIPALVSINRARPCKFFLFQEWVNVRVKSKLGKFIVGLKTTYMEFSWSSLCWIQKACPLRLDYSYLCFLVLTFSLSTDLGVSRPVLACDLASIKVYFPKMRPLFPPIYSVLFVWQRGIHFL